MEEKNIINAYYIYSSFGGYFSLTRGDAEIVSRCKLYLKGAKMVENIHGMPLVELPDGSTAYDFYGSGNNVKPVMIGHPTAKKFTFKVLEMWS